MVAHVRFKCPGCQTTLQAREEMRGELVSCPKCQRRLRLAEAAPKDTAKQAPQPFEDLPGLHDSGMSSPSALNDPSLWNPSTFSAAPPSQSPAWHTAPRQTSAYGGAQRYGGKQRYQVRDDREMTDADHNTQSTGIFLVVIPILAAILPLFGLQLRRLAGAGEFAPLAAMILGFIGAGIIAYARRGRHDAALAGIAAVMITLVFGVGGFLLQVNSLEEDGNSNDESGSRQANGPANAPRIQRGGIQANLSPPLEGEQESQRRFEEHMRRSEEMRKQAEKDRDEFMRQMQENRSDFSRGFPSQRVPNPRINLPRFGP